MNLSIPLVNPSLITVTAAPDTIPSPCDIEAATLVLGAGAHLHPAGFNYKGCSWDLTQLQRCTVVATNEDYSKYDLALSGMRNSEQHHVWLAFANCQHEAKERIKYLPALRRRSNNPAAVLCCAAGADHAPPVTQRGRLESGNTHGQCNAVGCSGLLHGKSC